MLCGIGQGSLFRRRQGQDWHPDAPGERSDRHESRRGRPLSLESVSSSGYDGGPKRDKREMSVNTRRKGEVTKVQRLRVNYRSEIEFILPLCGCFDAGYFGFEAAEGMGLDMGTSY